MRLDNAESESDEDGDSGGSRRHGGQPSPRDQWETLKTETKCQSQAMDKLMKLSGLHKVKIRALELFQLGLRFQQMDSEIRKKNMPSLNYRFVGNPGTGNQKQTINT